MIDLDSRIQEIEAFAAANNDTISYLLITDMLKDKKGQISSEDIDIVIKRLLEDGVSINGAEDEDYTSETDISPAFNPSDVNIHQQPLTVSNLVDELVNNEINLKPFFQRKADLWSREKQSRLIESLMLKIPIPAFYFDASSGDNYGVIDGLQRLTSFQKYLIDKEQFVGLQYFTDFNDKCFDELPRQYQRRINEAGIVAYIVDKGTPDSVVCNIFQRINTGGLRLEQQEIRHALYHGQATDIAEELACSEEFLEATQRTISSLRLKDQEYITRFIAFTELDYVNDYKGDIDDFLIMAMKKVNRYNTEELDRIRDNFRKVMHYASLIFGKYAFRKISETGVRGPVNKALFEMVSVIFTGKKTEELDALVKAKESIMSRYKAMFERPEMISTLRSGDLGSVKRRIEIGKGVLDI